MSTTTIPMMTNEITTVADTSAVADSLDQNDFLESISDPVLRDAAQNFVVAASSESTAATTQSLPPSSSMERLDDLEVALRSHLLQLIQSHNDNYDKDNDSYDQDATKQQRDQSLAAIGTFWKNALDLCHHFVSLWSASASASASASSCSELPQFQSPPRKLPLVMASDIVDTLASIEDVQIFWNECFEPALDNIILTPSFWTREIKLPFLKLCNQILRTIQITCTTTTTITTTTATTTMTAVEWKGRILWALSKGFSIGDASGKHHYGSVHASSTAYEDDSEFDKNVASSLTTTADDLSSSTPAGNLDYSLYLAFWSLQADFAKPMGGNFGDLIQKTNRVLEAFESAATVSDTTTTSATTTHSAFDAADSKKYLTSSTLLPAQINDPAFRCNVVTQFLIVASQLSYESTALKNMLAGLVVRARKLLQRDDPPLHDMLWSTILAHRENYWRQWKKDQKSAPAVFLPKRKATADEDNEGQNQKKMLQSRFPNGPLDREISQGDDDPEESQQIGGQEDLVRIGSELRQHVPSLEQHLEPYVEALDPQSGVEDEYHPKNDSLFTWRAHRLYAKHQLHLLSNCRGRSSDLERITRDWYKSQGKEIPGSEAEEEEEEEEEKDVDGSLGEKNDDDEPEKEGAVKGDTPHSPAQVGGGGNGDDDGDAAVVDGDGGNSIPKSAPETAQTTDDGDGMDVDAVKQENDDALKGEGDEMDVGTVQQEEDDKMKTDVIAANEEEADGMHGNPKAIERDEEVATPKQHKDAADKSQTHDNPSGKTGPRNVKKGRKRGRSNEGSVPDQGGRVDDGPRGSTRDETRFQPSRSRGGRGGEGSTQPRGGWKNDDYGHGGGRGGGGRGGGGRGGRGSGNRRQEDGRDNRYEGGSERGSPPNREGRGDQGNRGRGGGRGGRGRNR